MTSRRERSTSRHNQIELILRLTTDDDLRPANSGVRQPQDVTRVDGIARIYQLKRGWPRAFNVHPPVS